MSIVVPHKPGVQEWWQDAKGRDLVLKLEGVLTEERAYLPPKMLKCLARTDNLGQMLKQGKEKHKRKGYRSEEDSYRPYIYIYIYICIQIFIFRYIFIYLHTHT